MGKAWWLLVLALGAGCEGSTAAQRSQAPRLEALGVGFYRSPQVDW